MRLLLPEPQDAPDLERLYASPGRPCLRVGLVVSADGSAALGGLSAGLSGPPDRRVFSLLRSLPDVVLVGAGTARAERYRPVPVAPERRAARLARGQRETPVVAVVSRGPGLPAGSPLLEPGAGTLLVTTAAGARVAPAGVEAVVAGDAEVALPAAVAALRARGLAQVLCEGGPRLVGALATAGLVDELCLTTAPALVGGDGPRPVLGGAEHPRRLELRHLLEEDGWLLARWTAAPAGPQSRGALPRP